MINYADSSWYGSWSPGIGDPTWIGWTITVAYFLSAWLCFKAFRRARSADGSAASNPTAKVWLILTVGLLALGFNKQLDLQNLLREVGRWATHHYGWYEQRRQVQFLFFAFLLALVVAAVVLILIVRERLPELGFSFIGVVLLLTFVTVRAGSFEHVRMVPAHPWLPVPGRSVLELSGIASVGAGAWRWLRKTRPRVN